MIGKNMKFNMLTVVALAVITGGIVYAVQVRAQDEKPAAASDTAKEAPKAKDTAAAPATTDAPQNAWAVRCDEMKEGEKVTGQYCEMVQNISVAAKEADPSTAQRLIEMAIGYPPANKGKASAVVILPLGVLVTEKIDIEIDGSKRHDFNIRFCEAGGCVGLLPLSEKEMDKFSKGKALTVKAVAANGQPVTIEMSLAGFGEAHTKIKPKKD